MKYKLFRQSVSSILALLITLTVVIGGLEFSVSATDGVISLNSNGYYELYDADDLYAFSKKVNNGNTSINAKLMDNIAVNSGIMSEETNIADIREWTPIGNSSNIYEGIFDGNNKIISGLYFNDSSTDCGGVFGYIDSNAKIHNLGLENTYFNSNSNVGGICGILSGGSIVDCYSEGNIYGSGDNIGGICGYNYSGEISNCYNNGIVNGNSSVGGLCGNSSSGIIENSYNTGSVYGNSNVGGVCGYSDNDYITTCFSTGEIVSDGNFGGICGYYSTNMIKCYSNIETDDTSVYKTNEQFKSGEVAYLLNGDQSVITFYQTINEGVPMLSGETVYRVEIKKCDGSSKNPKEYSYTNETNASDIISEHNFLNGICTNCGEIKDGIGAVLVGHSLSLSGKIGVNFYMMLSDDVASDSTTYMRFNLPNGTVSDVSISDAGQSGDYYYFSCEVAAKEMTDEITAQIFTENGQKSGEIYTYTVKNYIDYLLEHSENEEYSAAADLVKSMANYGACAQEYFQHNTTTLANDNVLISNDVSGVTAETLSVYDNSNIQENEFVSFEGANLKLESATSIGFYFKTKTDDKLTFMYGEKVLNPVVTSDYTYVEVAEIKSNELSDDVVITISNGNTSFYVTYNAMTYCYNVLSRETTATRTESLKNLVKSLYLYNAYAMAYFSN